MRKKRSKTTLIWSIAVVIIALAFLLNSVISRLGGKVSAGSYKELIGKDYRAVETHFQSAGFTNIQLIDLNDSKTGYLDEGKVDTVSVGGNTSFNVIHWFEPDTPVTISYR